MPFFDFFQKKPDVEKEHRASIAPINTEDTIAINAGGINAYSLSGLDSAKMTESDSIDAWREFAERAEISRAVQEIINEAIIAEGDKFMLDLNLDEIDGLPKSVKKKITEEFSEILRIISFKRNAQELFRKWFVDGKQYFHLIVDAEKQSEGIQEIRWIDPKTMRKVAEMEVDPNSPKGIRLERVKETYFVYSSYSNTRRLGSGYGVAQNGVTIKVAPEAIAYSGSGITKTDQNSGVVYSVSHLDRALRVGNQLRLLEDSVVIYRLSRAPERRVFYIDIGNLPKTKGEQYLKDVMSRFRNKVTYDPATGKTNDQRNALSVMEDYWLPRREGGRGTEVTTLEGGQNLGELSDVEYFYSNLYKALQIPGGRLQSENMFNIGRSAEISREEVKFQKYIFALRNKFAEVFIQMLKTQLLLKNIVTGVEFDEIAGDIGFTWGKDSYWEELKQAEILNSRLAILMQADAFVGKYFSREWVQKNVLMRSDEEIDAEKEKMEQDKKDFPPETEGDPGAGGVGFGQPNIPPQPAFLPEPEDQSTDQFEK